MPAREDVYYLDLFDDRYERLRTEWTAVRPRQKKDGTWESFEEAEARKSASGKKARKTARQGRRRHTVRTHLLDSKLSSSTAKHRNTIREEGS